MPAKLLIVLGGIGLIFTAFLVLAPVETDGYDCGSLLSATDYHADAVAGDPPAMFAEDNCDSARSLRTKAAIVFGVPAVVAFGMGMFLDVTDP